MRHHTITEAELDEWMHQPQWQAFARCFGEGANKKLEVDGKAFRVTNHGEIVFLGADMAAAVAAYNNAR